MNLVQGKNDWYRIRNATDTQVATVHIYDEIGYFGVSAEDFIHDMADVTGSVLVHLNSPGGEVSDGITIYNALQALDDVEIQIDGMAASIASVVAMAASPGKLRISPHAQVMVHNPYTMACGDASDLRELADRLDANADIIAGIYAERTDLPASHWKKVMAATTWYTGQEAVDAGLCDGLVQSRKQRAGAEPVEAKSAVIPMHTFDTSMYRQGVMANKAEPVKDAAAHPYHSETDTSHRPISGVHSHNHAAFGHPDGDDGIHHHSHYHSNDGVHDHGHMSHGHEHGHDHPHDHAHDAGQHRYGEHEHDHTHHVVDPDHDGDDDSRRDDGHGGGDTDHDYFASVREHIMNSSAHIMDASYDDSSWDGGAAMKAAGGASGFRAICAGRRDGPADERGSWALPHHKHPGSPPNRAGVNNALSRLSGTEGLINKSAAEAHLRAHQKAWASEPSDSAGDEGYTEEDARLLIESLKGN